MTILWVTTAESTHSWIKSLVKCDEVLVKDVISRGSMVSSTYPIESKLEEVFILINWWETLAGTCIYKRG